jgi:hypothetical protein
MNNDKVTLQERCIPMPESVTLEQVEELATQLPPGERLKLVARVCEQLSVALPGGGPEEQGQGEAKHARMAQFEQWLTVCEEVAELWEGEFDSAVDVRRMRDER